MFVAKGQAWMISGTAGVSTIINQSVSTIALTVMSVSPYCLISLSTAAGTTISAFTTSRNRSSKPALLNNIKGEALIAGRSGKF